MENNDHNWDSGGSADDEQVRLYGNMPLHTVLYLTAYHMT